MAKQKTGVGRLIAKIGSWIGGLWRSAKNSFEQQPEETKMALKIGAGVVHIINENLDEESDVVLEKIQTAFPLIDAQMLDAALKKIAARYDIQINEGIVAGLQSFFRSHRGIDWADVSDGAAKIISIVFAPNGTKSTTIISLIWWVYQNFFHKNKKA